jgi:hypothetical protein
MMSPKSFTESCLNLDTNILSCNGQIMKFIILISVIISLSGCTLGIDKAVREHRKVSHMVQLGDSKQRVLAILMPTQESLGQNEIKPPERYIKGKDKIEIYYMRSGRQPDGLTTDDEFTPYYFKNGILSGVGWQQLGGAKSHGKVVPRTNINNSTTIIDY